MKKNVAFLISGQLLLPPLLSLAQWSLTGNSGTSPGTNFLGTTDNQRLVFKTNNTERFTILSTGNVGIGTSVPNATMSVFKPITNDAIATLGLFGYSNNTENRSVSIQQIGNAFTAHQYFFLNGGLGTGTTLGSPVLTSAYAHSFGFESNDENLNILTAPGGTNMTAIRAMSFLPNGNVGIGITAPQEKLHVGGKTLIETDWDAPLTLKNSDDSWQYMQFIGNGVRKSWMGIDPYNNFNIYKENGGNILLMGSKVGIGTANPQAKLAVNGDIFSKKIKVTQTGWPDYVFHPSYSPRP